MKEKKKALRAAVRKAACAREIPLPETEGWRAERQTGGAALIDRMESLPEFAAAHTVALYHALPDEVPTAALLHRWQGVKRLALPVVHPDGTMTFHQYLGPGDTAPGAFGIDEPRGGREIPPEEIDLVLIPGVAFDPAGRRLGRGRGFYDRYLAHPAAAHIYKVGICHPQALVPEVPAEPHDVVMDKIILGD